MPFAFYYLCYNEKIDVFLKILFNQEKIYARLFGMIFS